MSFWLYHQQMPLCRVRRLHDDRAASGTIVLALPANLAGDLSVLTGALELYEDRTDQLDAIQGLAVRLAGDEVELTIMTMGRWHNPEAMRFNDDWLLVDGYPLCMARGCTISADRCPRGAHVRLTIDEHALRRLNYRRRQLAALRQIQQSNIHAIDDDTVGLMLPLVYDGPEMDTHEPATVELLRLRQRVRLPIQCELADAGHEAITLIGHAGEAAALQTSRRAHRTAAHAGVTTSA